MSSVIESVEWGKPALTLLSQCKQLNPNLPAVMHIRHTERPKSTQESYDLARKTGRSTLLSTKKGKQAAFDFGEHLPSNRVYRVYHSPIERARETAEKIHEGLLSQGAESHLKGIFMRINNNQVKRRDYLQRYRPAAFPALSLKRVVRISGFRGKNPAQPLEIYRNKRTEICSH